MTALRAASYGKMEGGYPLKINNSLTQTSAQSAGRPTDTRSTAEALSVLAKSVLQASGSRKQEIAPYPDFDGSQVCAQVDPELFFPDPNEPRMAEPRVVKSLCHDCDFLIPCFEYAMHHDVMGIWGATTALDRSILRRRLNITPVPMADTLKVG